MVFLPLFPAWHNSDRNRKNPRLHEAIAQSNASLKVDTFGSGHRKHESEYPEASLHFPASAWEGPFSEGISWPLDLPLLAQKEIGIGK
jgi:hypothetical protein